MTLRSYITAPERFLTRNVRTPPLLFACVIILLMAAPLTAQRVAIVAPDKADQSRNLADRLRSVLDGKVRTLDEMLSTSAFDSLGTDSPFNLTTDDTKRVSSAIGCEFLILVRSATQRRSASGRADYYEANAAIFVASARTGSLIYFNLLRLEDPRSSEATAKLMLSVDKEAARISDRIKESIKAELTDA